MGLDTTHDAYHGGYAGYSIMREALGRAAGWTMDPDKHMVAVDWGKDSPDTIGDEQPEWARARFGDIDRDEWPWDPIIFLWAHEDCEGVIPPAMAGAIAARIEELLPKVDGVTQQFAPAWSKEYAAANPAFVQRTTTALASRFAKGLRLAHRRNEKVTYR